jgi:hypothetical protein
MRKKALAANAKCTGGDPDSLMPPTRTKWQWTMVGFTIAYVLSYSPGYGQSSSPSNPATIPSATNDVKAGDWINWQVKQDVLTEVKNTSSPKSGTPKSPAPADVAAAANALQSAANDAIVPASKAAHAPNATQADKDKWAAALDALDQAESDAKKTAIANSKPSVGPNTVAAAQDQLSTAQKSAISALADVTKADQQKFADQLALETAKNPTQALKDKAAASARTADEKHAAEAKAEAIVDAALAAYNKVLTSAAALSPPTFCAPPGSRFLVTNVVPGNSTTNATPSTTPTTTSTTPTKASAGGSSNAQSSVATVEGFYPARRRFFHLQAITQYAPPRTHLIGPGPTGSLTPPQNVVSPCGSDTTLPSYDTLYQFQATPEVIGSYDREGFTWGAMLIPYKFYVKDRTFKGNPSTVAFVGYEGWVSGLSLAGVVALGPGIAQNATASSPATTTPTTKSPTTSTAITYTAATGFVVTFGGSIKAGLLVGWDWQGSGNNFQYEGKTWMALSIGTSF